jgi:RimJ/RimL family protein N-acetyltransferase
VFNTPHFVVRPLLATELPTLQTLFEANPDFFLTLNARLPFADEAEVEFYEVPPAHLSSGKRWFAGVFDQTHTLQGVVHVVSDLIAPSVWHIALLFVATPLRGTGAAQEIYAALESWMKESGAGWIRLGVVIGNSRAERFWDRLGYHPTRLRTGVDTGGKINDVQMMLKPLSGGAIEQYFALVPRDHPDSSLP